MVEFDELDIEQLVVHKIGNKMRDEGIEISQRLHDLNDSSMKEILLKFFLRPFKAEKFFNFTHEGQLDLNEVYFYVKNIFTGKGSFYDESVRILKHLYEKSNHPNIKSGEFYVAYFKNHSLTNKRIDVIGLFKTENRDTYLKVNQANDNFNINYDRGINIDKLDKGCLVINDEMQNGFKVLIIDASAKSQNNEAQYWKNSFLNLKEVMDDNYTTDAFLKICNSFSSNINVDQLNNTTINDTFKFKNSTYNYFEQNSTCSLNDFLEDVFDNEELKDEFLEYKARYEEKNHIIPIETFNISPTTVMKLKERFKSKIKLDTGFEIKVVNDKYLEKGLDEEKNMSFYKVYFRSEK